MNEERGLLMAILEQPDDDIRKLIYADWLDEHNDPRGEYFRLMIKVRRERVITAEQRQKQQRLSTELVELRAQELEAWRSGRGDSRENHERERRSQELERQLADLSRQMRQPIPGRLQELAATFDPNWLAVVSDTEIEGCGKTAGEGWRPRFDVVCDETWADLKPTHNNTVRHCEKCSKRVYFCDNLADAREHSQEGHCIALDLGIIRRDGDLVPPVSFVGQPSEDDIRETYQENIDPVSHARLDARKNARKRRSRGL